MSGAAEGVVVEEGAQPQAGALARVERSGVVLAPVMNVGEAARRLKEFQEFVQGYLVESQTGGEDGGDYGIIPGTKKKTLLKSGAEKLCEIYGMYDEYEIVAKVEEWDRGLFDYELRCVLKSRRDDSIIGTGLGSCSTFESKYRWRLANRKCPSCGAEAIIKGKKEYDRTGGDGGWLCYGKKGGCGAKFDDNDAAIVRQDVGRVENPDIIDAKNTVLKIAKKRAKIDAVIGVTRSSGLFTQDLEDHEPADRVVVESVKGESVKPGETVQDEPARSNAAGNSATAQQPAASNSNGNGGGRVISEAQAKRMFAIGRDAGFSKEDYTALLKRFGYNDDRDVLRSHYDEICKELQA